MASLSSNVEDGYCSSSISKSSYCPSDDENAIVHDLNSKVYRKDSEIAKLRSLLSDKEVTIKRMKKCLDDMEKSLCDTNLQNRALEEQVSQLKSKISNDKIDHDKTVSFLESRIRSLEEQHSETKSKFTEQIFDLRTTVKDLETRNRSLEDKFEKSERNALLFDAGTNKRQEHLPGKFIVFSAFFAAAVTFYSVPNLVNFYASYVASSASLHYPF